MNFIDGCLLDTLSGLSIIDDLAYYVGFSESKKIESPSFNQSIENCQVAWSIFTVDEAGTE